LSSAEEFIKNRLDDQIKWYGEKSALNKRRYRLFQIVIIIAGAIIPIMNLASTAGLRVGPMHSALFASSILGSIITVITAFLQMEKYFENWILYRTTAESLKREKVLYENDAGEYTNLSEIDKSRILVERVEAMLSSENSKFFALQQQSREYLVGQGQPQPAAKTTEPATAKTTEPATAKTTEPATAKTTEPATAKTTEPATAKTTETRPP
jgi:hypothetical protein